ncbi:TPA: hypothetical protein DCY67_00425 [Candidatus Acetothermia bacterium]|nr:hypothetical protein [Candidatus Acetothermia bacterium]
MFTLRQVHGDGFVNREEVAHGTRCDPSWLPGVTDKATRNERIHQAVRAHRYTLKEVGECVGLLYSTNSVIAKRADEKERKS